MGEALIAVSTPVSENLPEKTVTSALEAFKAVGQKVSDRADDIEAIHTALQHAVTVTRNAQTAVQEMDGDQRDKPEFPPSKPGDDETDEMHNLKVYSGQMNLYNSWATARETQSQQHADKVETAWKDAIAVMEKVPDDQVGGGGSGGGGGGGDRSDHADAAPRRRTPTTTPTTPDRRRPGCRGSAPSTRTPTDRRRRRPPDAHADPVRRLPRRPRTSRRRPRSRRVTAGHVPPTPYHPRPHRRRPRPVPGRHAVRRARHAGHGRPPVRWRRRRRSRRAR